MSALEIMDQLKHLSNAERLAVIEAATHLIRNDLLRQADPRVEQERRLREQALALQDLYEPGGELTEWTSLDAVIQSTEFTRR